MKMKLHEQYVYLVKLKQDINDVLSKGNDISALIKQLDHSSLFNKFMQKDTDIYRFNVFSYIFLREQCELRNIGIEDNIFEGVRSLSDLEKKYLSIEFAMLRLETKMPEEYYLDGISNLVDENISGIAIGRVISLETAKVKENILKTADILLQLGEYSRSIVLLKEASSILPDDESFEKKIKEICNELEGI